MSSNVASLGRQPENSAACANARVHRRLLDQRKMVEFGHELPLEGSEAAEYVGVPTNRPKQHGTRRKGPMSSDDRLRGQGMAVFPSELDDWLSSRVLDGRLERTENTESTPI